MDSGAGAENLALQTAFISVKAAPSIASHQAHPATIRIEVPHSKGAVVVRRPAESAGRVPLSYETYCDDPRRFHLARHRAHGHARRH